MNEQNEEKWLDELISRTINTTRPEFDAEQWKQKYPEEFQILKSRAQQKPSTIQPSLWKTLTHNKLAKLAAAAVLIVAVGLLVFSQISYKQKAAQIAQKPKSPTEMLTAISLTMAYRRGGIEAVDRQSQEAIKMLGPRPAEITIQQILTEFNGT
jgi:hypothetical protein